MGACHGKQYRERMLRRKRAHLENEMCFLRYTITRERRIGNKTAAKQAEDMLAAVQLMYANLETVRFGLEMSDTMGTLAKPYMKPKSAISEVRKAERTLTQTETYQGIVMDAMVDRGRPLERARPQTPIKEEEENDDGGEAETQALLASLDRLRVPVT